ncbi:MAG: response regulator transcription factor [Cyclobacteriaceae bacterium]
MSVKILLADDHQIVVDGLKLILSSNEHFEIVGEVENGQEVLDFLENQKVHIVVLDINMPVMDGITCAKKIKSLYKHVKVIILTMYAQKSFIEEIIQIGIDGCLLKNNTGKELADAIDRVHSGRSYYDQIQSFSSDNEEVKQHKLSERELDIIKCQAEGLTSSQIADKLFISLHTVKTHRKNILKKLDLHNSSELIQYALNNGII